MTRPARHGTLSRHKRHGCKCAPCREAGLAYQRQRYRKVGYGTWQPLADAQPVREHIAPLVADGYTIRSIAAAADTDMATVCRVLYGPSKQLRTETAQRLLRLTANDLTQSEHRTIDATGTRRRLQALMVLGWPLSRIAGHVDIHPRRVVDIVKGERVYISTARRIEAGYRRLIAMNPAAHGVPQNQITTARRHAAARGWHGPLAWDDIDNPAEQPDTEGVAYLTAQPKYTSAEAQHIAGEIRHLAAFGVPAHEIAARVQRSETYVRDQLRGARGPGWRQQIGEAA